MLEIGILILSVLANSILGLAVYLKNPHKDVNRLFFYLTLSLSFWAIVTYYSIHPVGLPQISWVRLVLASASVLCYFVLTSFAVFPDYEFHKLKLVKLATVYLLFVVLITQTSLVFKSLCYDTNGSVQPIVAPGIIFFMLLVFSFLGGAIWLLLRRFHHSQGVIRNQLRIVIWGLVTSFAAILVTNLLLVSLFKNTSFISFAPLLTLILTGSMAYAILKHKLFDLRLAVARAMAYVLTFVLVLLVYSGLAFSLGGIFSFQSGIHASQRIFFVALAVITALAFQPAKRFFDKATNRIFYQDAYEPQELLDKVTDTLVGNVSLDSMLEESSKIIVEHMKLVGCNFLIRSKDQGYRMVGPAYRHKQDPPEGLIGLISVRHDPFILTDDLGYRQEKLKNLLIKMDLAVTVKLSTKTTTVGYMLVGNKKSGDIINSTDVNVLGILADTLAIAIENALRFEEIQQFNITLQQKVDEATKELKKVNSRLRELDKTKDEFISMASHQLRTPLTTVKGYLSMILEGDVGAVKKDQKELMQHAFDGANRMVYLIADLLNVSRLQTGKFVIDNKPTNLAEVVSSEISQLNEQAANREIKLVYHKPDSFPVLNLDETKIRQVVMNFLDNALYYTPKGGSVTVDLQATDKEVSYTVTDTGVGVPKDEQHHLFSKFYRAGNARKMRPDGTGLGLFMAKKVIAAQGGAIIFKSTEGKGSTFGFSFPRAKVEA